MHAGSTDARLDALGAKIDDLARNIGQRFEQVDKRFEERFDQFEKRFEERFEQVDKHSEQVERRLEALESRFFYLQLTLTGGLLGFVATLLATSHL